MLRLREEQDDGSVEIFAPVSLCTLETILRCAFSCEDDIQSEG